MTVMLSDVVDLRSDCSIPLNVDEEVYMVTIALPRQLYDEEVVGRLKKHQLFPILATSSGPVPDDHCRAFKLRTCLGLNVPEERFEEIVEGMKEVNKKTKLREI